MPDGFIEFIGLVFRRVQGVEVVVKPCDFVPVDVNYGPPREFNDNTCETDDVKCDFIQVGEDVDPEFSVLSRSPCRLRKPDIPELYKRRCGKTSAKQLNLMLGYVTSRAFVVNIEVNFRT